MDIIRKLAEELNIRPAQAQAAVKLIDEGNTIPFIARYRKEATGSLNDEVLQKSCMSALPICAIWRRRRSRCSPASRSRES